LSSVSTYRDAPARVRAAMSNRHGRAHPRALIWRAVITTKRCRSFISRPATGLNVAAAKNVAANHQPISRPTDSPSCADCSVPGACPRRIGRISANLRKFAQLDFSESLSMRTGWKFGPSVAGCRQASLDDRARIADVQMAGLKRPRRVISLTLSISRRIQWRLPPFGAVRNGQKGEEFGHPFDVE
jgi:hypothetical protein